jgi:hypothetical protein
LSWIDSIRWNLIFLSVFQFVGLRSFMFWFFHCSSMSLLRDFFNSHHWLEFIPQFLMIMNCSSEN